METMETKINKLLAKINRLCGRELVLHPYGEDGEDGGECYAGPGVTEGGKLWATFDTFDELSAFLDGYRSALVDHCLSAADFDTLATYAAERLDDLLDDSSPNGIDCWEPEERAELEETRAGILELIKKHAA